MENRASDMQEEWIRLEQGIIPEGQYIVKSLIQNSDGTKVVLDDEKNVVEIIFDGIPSLVRTAKEGIRMRTWSEVQLKYKNKFFLQNWFFYQVQNSKLSKWVKEESCNFYEEEQLKHYCIVTMEEAIDILATFKPLVKVSKI